MAKLGSLCIVAVTYHFSSNSNVSVELHVSRVFQYEKGKPLVNLVDNMVKLGSLYRGSGMSLHSGTGGPADVHSVRERLEFNQKVQEQRLLAEERRDWDRVSPDRGQLQVNTRSVLGLS